MQLKTAIKYNLTILRKPLLIFYGICFVIYAFMLILFLSLDNAKFNNGGVIQGMGFLFPMGIMFYVEFFKMFLQNGISRKTMFKSSIISLLLCAVTMSVIDGIVTILFENSNVLTSLPYQIYGDFITPQPKFIVFAEIVFMDFAMYFFMAVLGYFFGILFSRMTRLLRMIVPIGLLFIIFILTIIDTTLTDHRIISAVASFFMYITGFKNDGNINYLSISGLCFAGIFTLFSWLLFRRATIKSLN